MSRIPYSARLLDSAGAAQPLAVPDVRWSVAGRNRGSVRLGRPRADAGGVTVWADAEVVRAGRDTVSAVFAGATAEPGFGTVTAWEWTEAVTRRPAVWTRPGESRCAEMGAESADGETLVLSEFQRVYARSLDPGTVSVDSTTFTADGEAVRICVTGRAGGTGRIALVGWDTLALRYVGAYEPHHVLAEPIVLGVEHERWEIGRGQRETLRGLLTDARGLEVALPAAEGVSWTTSDGGVAAVDATTGEMVGAASGSARISAAHLGQTASAEVEVYEIVDGAMAWGVICVLTRRGTVRCFGDGDQSSIGYGRGRLGLVRGPEAGDVPLGGRARALFGRSQSICALMEASEVRCWGSNLRGQIGYGVSFDVGDNETPAEAGPVPVGGAVAGFGRGEFRGCAVLEGGALRCWGENQAGQLGYGIAVPDHVIGDDETPADIGDVPVGGRVVQVTGGRLWTCALMETGAVRCWGINSDQWDPKTRQTGQNYGLGYGRAHGFHSPVGDDETPAEVGDLPLPGRAVKLAGNGYHACALMEDGTVRCWGFNGFGALGHGLGDGHHIGDDETAADAVPLRFPGRVADIVAGYFFTCALLEEGEVYCWGLPDRGTLGYGNEERIGDDETAASAGPVPIGGPAEALFTGDEAACAVLRSGPLICWGDAFDLPFNPEHIGDDETPADVDPVRVFPGPVPDFRIGGIEADRQPVSVLAAQRAPRRHVVFSDVERGGAAPHEPFDGGALPLPAPLAGAEGVLPPDSTSGSWIRVAAKGR
ncbi:hypothetical protein [Candidatus Palauibacter sp.]|uniref:hypothetical protein n=1 Tax=Candidatus Palauibacter sp. TaxID=3101350 RepID=UPI003B0105AD